jgi:hypothetical protein
MMNDEKHSFFGWLSSQMFSGGMHPFLGARNFNHLYSFFDNQLFYCESLEGRRM